MCQGANHPPDFIQFLISHITLVQSGSQFCTLTPAGAFNLLTQLPADVQGDLLVHEKQKRILGIALSVAAHDATRWTVSRSCDLGEAGSPPDTEVLGQVG